MLTKIIIKIFLLSLIFFVSAVLPAQNEEEIFRQGNEYYKQKQFDKAIESYSGLVNSGYEGTSLFYNLGNSYYRTGEIGLAILFYEKALKLSPGDEDIRHNLNLANLKTVDRVESIPQFFLFEWWEGLLAFFSASGWTIAAYIFYLVLIFSAGFYFFAKNPLQQKIVLVSALAGFILLAFSTILLVVKLNKEINNINAVIIKNSVNVKLSPDEQSNDAFIIHKGLKVKFEDEVEDWVKIRLEDGKVGWIQEDDAKII
jgi:tetratricopeptide (TPR) repeat protein